MSLDSNFEDFKDERLHFTADPHHDTNDNFRENIPSMRIRTETSPDNMTNSEQRKSIGNKKSLRVSSHKSHPMVNVTYVNIKLFALFLNRMKLIRLANLIFPFNDKSSLITNQILHFRCITPLIGI